MINSEAEYNQMLSDNIEYQYDNQREMKTPMQEHIEWLKKEYELILKLGGENQRLLIKGCIEKAESMLDKEKEVMVDFAYKFGDEPLAEIAKWYDKQFNINEK